MLSVGIIGLGAISKVHVEAVERLPNAEITAVCDTDPDKREKYPYKFYLNAEDMLKNEELDCVHICLPHYEHVAMTELAVKYKTPVFLEKPVGLSTAQWTRLINLEKKSGIKIGICLQNRYNQTTLEALKAITSKVYGELKGCKAILTWDRRKNYYDKDPWRSKVDESGGGVMLSQAIHLLDLIGLFGGEITSVKGFAGNLMLEDIEVEDTACGSIYHSNGVTSVFYCTVAHHRDTPVSFELDFGTATLELRENRLIQLKDDEEKILAEDLVNEDKYKSYYGTGHQVVIKAFYGALTAGTNRYIHLTDAFRVSKLIEGVMESARSGKRVDINA